MVREAMKIGALGRAPQLPSRVAAAITAEIAEGRLREGDRLPTEQALAEKFGVSRNVVREAISRLRSDGVVQSRQGVGAFVVSSEATMTAAARARRAKRSTNHPFKDTRDRVLLSKVGYPFQPPTAPRRPRRTDGTSPGS